MVKHERYITVEVESFSRSMQKLFEGVAEVFASIGMEAPDCLQTEKLKWRPEENAGITDKAEGVDTGDKSAGTHTDKVVAVKIETPTTEPSEFATQKMDKKKTKESAVPAPSVDEPDFPVDDEPPFDVDAKDSTSTPEVPDTPEDSSTPETTDVPEFEKQEETAITPDDITKIIVQKIKQNRSNNQRIGQLLKTYGVSKVSELPKSKYEAFITELAAM